MSQKEPRIDPTIQLLLDVVDRAYDKKSWHGPNLRGALTRVTAEEALWRPGKGRHNIWELALHTAYWKYAVRRRLVDEKRGSFPLKGSNWFAVPTSLDETKWKEAKALLEQQHQLVREAILAVSVADLPKIPPGAKVPNVEIIYGLAAHDVYHAGQIQLTKKLMRA